VNLTWKRRMEQVRRRWWLVALTTVLAVLAAGLLSLFSSTAYVGKSTLMLSGRAPEQDAVMILGYLTLFNDPATTSQLRATEKIPEDIALEAFTAASSPILAIEATADDPDVAQDAAEDAARAFSADVINSAQRAGREKLLADLERQVAGVKPLAPDGSTNPYYASLRTRIDDTRSASSNELLSLQPRAGVTESAPSTAFNLLAGLVGGVLLGVLVALGHAAMSPRLTSRADLRDKTAIEPLAEVPAAELLEPGGQRTNSLRALANIIALEDLPRPRIIALTDSSGGHGARIVAEALAELSAQQRSRTVLVYADNDESYPAAGVGFNDALAASCLLEGALKKGGAAGLEILPAGTKHVDRYSLATRERIVAILDKLRPKADVIILVAPPVADASETQLLCGVSDTTILVVRKGAKAGEVISAADTLVKAHALLLGAVLVETPSDREWSWRSARTEDTDGLATVFPEGSIEHGGASMTDSREEPVGERATESIA
jgi:Mrp family chromosome partitioning ATPase